MADQKQTDDSNPLTDVELERLKMYQDSFKHMTTFSSGAILLASAVTGALFLPKPDIPLILGFSIRLLSMGALAAMLGLAFAPRYIDLAIHGSREPSPLALAFLLRVSVATAYFGLLSFALFAWTNVYP